MPGSRVVRPCPADRGVPGAVSVAATAALKRGAVSFERRLFDATNMMPPSANHLVAVAKFVSRLLGVLADPPICRGSFVRSITSIIYKAHKTLFRFGFCLSFFVVACRHILQVEPVDYLDVIIWLSVFVHQRFWQQCHVSDLVLVALTSVSVVCCVRSVGTSSVAGANVTVIRN